jgi:ribose transport system substrate-binding protein
MSAANLITRRFAAAAALITIVTALSACASSSSDSTSSSTSAPTSTSSASASDLAAVSALLAKYSKTQPPASVEYPKVPGAATKLSGKSVYYIPILTNAPLFQSQANLLKNAVSAVGMTLTVCNGNENPADLTTCFNQAIDSGAAGIIADSVPPQLVPHAYAEVVTAKVPTVALNINEPVPAQYASMVTAFDRQEITQGRITADQIIADAGGKAHVLLIGLNTSATTTNTLNEGIKPEFKSRCPACTVTEIELNGSQLANVPSIVAAGLVQNPDTNYVDAEYDVLVPGAIQGISEEQKQSTVKLASVNGTLSAMQSIKSGTMFADTGNDINYEAWASVDMLIRMIMGMNPEAEQHSELIPLRTYTKATISDITLTPSAYQSGNWFGTPSYDQEFAALWGAK